MSSIPVKQKERQKKKKKKKMSVSDFLTVYILFNLYIEYIEAYTFYSIYCAIRAKYGQIWWNFVKKGSKPINI